jgi:hypothetical protein
MEYGSRRMQFHRFTLRVCFELGEAYKRQYDQVNAHACFAKALKLAIFLGDKFSELKAIDQFGVSAYLASKLNHAHFYHENADKLSKQERETIREKYSNNEELEKLCALKAK